MYPIKYVENNLVFNQEGECFAYYELVPYNYSFLSPEQKYQVHDNFRQLIAQNREGKIHALQLPQKVVFVPRKNDQKLQADSKKSRNNELTFKQMH